jgi:hypothetical protein
VKPYKIIPFLLITILLLAACGEEPAISVSAPDVSSSASVSASQRPAPSELYSGSYSEYILPQSIPVISEADRKTFNPARTSDYLITSPCAGHKYTIKGAEKKGGKLYLIISDSVYFGDPVTSSDYLKEVFSLSNEDILKLPEFKNCYLNGLTFFSDEGFVSKRGSLPLSPLPMMRELCWMSLLPIKPLLMIS